MRTDRALALFAGSDDSAFRLASKALAETCDIVRVTDGAAAEARVREKAFALILLDLDLPGKPALELLKAALSWRRISSAIVLADPNRREESAAAVEAGAICGLIKPATQTELKAAAERALESWRLKRDLARATHRIEALTDALNEFLGSVSHDLRTPLAIMHGYAETLLRYGEKLDAGKRLAYLTYIRDGSTKLTQQMASFLNLSQKGGQELSPEKIDLRELVRATYEPMLEEGQRGLEFRFSLEASAKEIITDRKRLRHALEHIISDALSHSPDGGKIHVSGLLADATLRVELADTEPPAGGSPERAVDEERTEGRPEPRPPSIDLIIARCILKVLGGDVLAHFNDDGNGFHIEILLPKEYKPSKRSLRP